MTSSKTSIAPCSSHSPRSPSRNPCLGEDDAHVAGHRLDDERGHPVAMAAEDPFDRSEVVVARHQRVRRHRPRDPRAGGDAEGGGPRPRLHEKGVAVAVIAAGELDDAVPARRRPGEPQCAHRRLGARVHEPHPLDRRHEPTHRRPQLDLRPRRGPEARALLRGGGQRPGQPGRGVPVDEGAPRHDEVDVRAAVLVLDAGAAGPPDERRSAADGGEGADGAVDPAGENPLGAGEEAGGAASACSAHRPGTISRRPPRAARGDSPAALDTTSSPAFRTVPLARGSCARRGEATPVAVLPRGHRPPSGLIGRMRSARMACLEWRPSTGDDG